MTLETRAPVTFLEELKRRRLLRPVVACVLTAFAVLQVIEPIMHGLHWPDAVLTWTVIGLASGLPSTIAFAWMFGAHESVRDDQRQGAGLRHWVARNPALTVLATLVFLLCREPPRAGSSVTRQRRCSW